MCETYGVLYFVHKNEMMAKMKPRERENVFSNVKNNFFPMLSTSRKRKPRLLKSDHVNVDT